MVADDLCALAEQDGHFHALPGQPRLKLDRDTVTRLFGTHIQTQPFLELGPSLEQGKVLIEHAAVDAPCPLKGIYLIAGRDKQLTHSQTQVCDKSAALILLAKHLTFTQATDAELRKADFKVLARLVNQVPVRLLRNPDSLRLLRDTLADALV